MCLTIEARYLKQLVVRLVVADEETNYFRRHVQPHEPSCARCTLAKLLRCLDNFIEGDVQRGKHVLGGFSEKLADGHVGSGNPT